MKTDFEIIQHKFDRDHIDIIPIGDVHLGAIEHNEEAWEDFVRTLKDKPDTYVVLVGDLLNNGVRNAVSNPFDETMRPMEAKQLMTSHLSGIRDRILCAVSGNHEYRTEKESDMDITRDIMCKLDLEDVYRQNMAFLKIKFGTRKDGSPNVSYKIVITHGSGGGSTGSAVNRAESFGGTIEGCDAFITAHTHKAAVTRSRRIVFGDRPQAFTSQYLVVSCTSWLEYGGYAMRKMLKPSDTCNPQTLRISGDSHKKGIKVIW